MDGLVFGEQVNEPFQPCCGLVNIGTELVLKLVLKLVPASCNSAIPMSLCIVRTLTRF